MCINTDRRPWRNTNIVVPTLDWEFGEKRSTISDMDSADAMRRWLGLFCLTVSAGMLIWGQTILKPILEGWLYITYWTFCFIFTFGAILIALLDIRALRRRTQREQRELLERTLAEVEEERVRKQDSD
jgi:hypothetical protein